MSPAPRRIHDGGFRPQTPAFLAAFLVTAAVAAGWPSGCAKAVPCQFNSDCPVGYCVSGSCHMDCVDASRDCPPGYSCDQNAQCVPGSTTSSSAGGSGGGGGPATTSSTGSPTTSTSSTGSPTSTTSTGSPTSTTSTGSGTMSAHELDLCAKDADCASPLVCRAMIPGGAKRCTRTCTSNAGCM